MRGRIEWWRLSVTADVVTDAEWREGAQANFKGEVIVGADLLEI